MHQESQIQEALKTALETLGFNDVSVLLSHPVELTHGDYATNVALALAKDAKENPKALAEKIVAALPKIAGVEKVEVAGIGFINFHLSREYFTESIHSILEEGKNWGRGDSLKGERIMYEYTDPNPFKVFHIGHLMSNALGEALARIAEASGAEVVRANYQGDIGPHVAKCIWGLQKNNFNPESIEDISAAYVYGSTAYEDDAHAKEEIDSINTRLYAGDPELKEMYDAGRKTSLEHFEVIYKILGTTFDHYFFESEVASAGIEVVKKGLADGVFEESDGAVVYKGEKKGLHTRVFLTSKGTPTYETKELGLDKTKFEKEKLTHSVIITANEQDGFFKVVLAAMEEVLPEVAEKTKHISHGMMQLVGGKMSSRKGNVITGESLIADMRERAYKKMEERSLGNAKHEVADAVAVAAIKYEVLKQGTGKNIVFDPDASLSFEGDSGPYLQYAHVRALSILRKAKEAGLSEFKKDSEAPATVTALERLLYRLPRVIERAQNEHEPHHITTFLTELASAFNSWYANEKIIDESDKTSTYKVGLVSAFALTMKNGLTVLGIRTPEVM